MYQFQCFDNIQKFAFEVHDAKFIRQWKCLFLLRVWLYNLRLRIQTIVKMQSS